jgi:hypothetical protein
MCGHALKQAGTHLSISSGFPASAKIAIDARTRFSRLFMAASHSLYSLYVNTQGAIGG